MVTVKEGRRSNKPRKYGNVLDMGNIITSYSSKVLRAPVLLMPGKAGLAVPACQQCKQPTLTSPCSFSELLEGRECNRECNIAGNAIGRNSWDLLLFTFP